MGDSKPKDKWDKADIIAERIIGIPLVIGGKESNISGGCYNHFFLSIKER